MLLATLTIQGYLCNPVHSTTAPKKCEDLLKSEVSYTIFLVLLVSFMIPTRIKKIRPTKHTIYLPYHPVLVFRVLPLSLHPGLATPGCLWSFDANSLCPGGWRWLNCVPIDHFWRTLKWHIRCRDNGSALYHIKGVEKCMLKKKLNLLYYQYNRTVKSNASSAQWSLRNYRNLKKKSKQRVTFLPRPPSISTHPSYKLCCRHRQRFIISSIWEIFQRYFRF